MLKDLESNFVSLEKKILKLTNNYKSLSEKYAELSDKYEKLKGKYEEESGRNEELQEEQRRIKLMSAISGNPEHNRLMKNHINRLVKEIDACIAQLQNTGI
ncbi:hypothetical protein ATB99_08495 [Elizabethkingia meningoseptica]|uniref:hypothetical protein n=1 Tax=Elizabethkingia meningoseptica TaxID=238 RepID=UPI000332C657|nr:hypothetical protein [Elizabethkingia meningoseptica]AQX06336.1 hypothetical protein BBD33_14195 [Elizabethkingia meningoseptica]AQX48385.1 hypothetical protein B5G46_14190 [Elizabethkingia meningoseptica]EOR30832.1 hypothetical protein L100_03812 [Elizabethkingia meningoseptica ATCC 13253 = NBRC 12535]KUY16470.1 hypothetical protein ATB99_08495 [Elizabethkingia meningoseptica]OPB75905.1 hypothetical protein BAY30_17050 [Elizabethkingia meningoseptica]